MASPQVDASQVIARQDKISVWSLPYLYMLIIGIGFLFTFYDIFDINVSFIQTCLQIVPGCKSPADATNFLGAPVLWNLIGYVIGALILSPIADRIGRRDMLLITMLITGLGSLATAFVGNYGSLDTLFSGGAYTTFIIARTITGIGIGADLAIVNTYINEVSPRTGRARYTSLIFITSGLGAFVGIWLGLILTTPPGDFPAGLPFAIAGLPPTQALFAGPGWRIMYIVGAALALVGILLRVQLPESPRWLVSRGRVNEANAIVGRMEARAARAETAALPVDVVPVQSDTKGRNPFMEILATPRYLARVIVLLLVWLLAYVTVYCIAAGLTSILAAQLAKSGTPEQAVGGTAGMIAAVGTIGFVACGVFAFYFSEKLARRAWLPIGAVLTIIGGLIIALTIASSVYLAFVGAIILFFGFNIWVPITYAWSTESFPTRARTTGFGIVDGIGHVGGGIGLVAIAPLLPDLNPVEAFLLISAFLVAAAIIAQFGLPATRGKQLDIVSP
ncbi:MAG TPA: MFS transporter [Ktedonobacterales bacterium]|jgi:MFS family permease